MNDKISVCFKQTDILSYMPKKVSLLYLPVKSGLRYKRYATYWKGFIVINEILVVHSPDTQIFNTR